MKEARTKFMQTHPKNLWSEYWQRFNTISIPLQDEDAFFLDLMEAAHQAETRPHLEELLEEKREERRRDMDKIVKELVFTSGNRRRCFPSPKARSATTQVGLTASLDSFIQVVCGVAYGWDGENAVPPEPREIQAPDELGGRGSSSPSGSFGNDDEERENRKTFEPGPGRAGRMGRKTHTTMSRGRCMSVPIRPRCSPGDSDNQLKQLNRHGKKETPKTFVRAKIAARQQCGLLPESK